MVESRFTETFAGLNYKFYWECFFSNVGKLDVKIIS